MGGGVSLVGHGLDTDSSAPAGHGEEDEEAHHAGSHVKGVGGEGRVGGPWNAECGAESRGHVRRRGERGGHHGCGRREGIWCDASLHLVSKFRIYNMLISFKPTVNTQYKKRGVKTCRVTQRWSGSRFR